MTGKEVKRNGRCAGAVECLPVCASRETRVVEVSGQTQLYADKLTVFIAWR